MWLGHPLDLPSLSATLIISNEEMEEIETKILYKYRMQTYDSIMDGYLCIGYIDFMLKSKSLLEYTNLFSPNEYKKNDKIILKYFQ